MKEQHEWGLTEKYAQNKKTVLKSFVHVVKLRSLQRLHAYVCPEVLHFNPVIGCDKMYSGHPLAPHELRYLDMGLRPSTTVCFV